MISFESNAVSCKKPTDRGSMLENSQATHSILQTLASERQDRKKAHQGSFKQGLRHTSDSCEVQQAIMVYLGRNQQDMQAICMVLQSMGQTQS